jgi:hypothetical protein
MADTLFAFIPALPDGAFCEGGQRIYAQREWFMLMGCLFATKLNDNHIPIHINIFGPLIFCQAETIFMRVDRKI